MSKPRLKQPAQKPAYVPQDKDECAQAIDQIGRLQRDIVQVNAAMNDEIADVTERYAGSISEKTAELTQLQHGVQAFCEAHRASLTENGKRKSAGFTTGDVMWRQRPPSVAVRGLDSVLETLQRLGLGRFIRTKEELNKDAILNEPDAIAGIAGLSIKAGVEDFVITPFEQELA